MEGVCAHNPSAVDTGRRGRCDAGVYSRGRRIRHSHTPGVGKPADDRSRTVRRVLREPRLAGGERGRDCDPDRAAGSDRDLSALSQPRAWSRGMTGRRTMLLPTILAFGFAFLYVPILSMVVYSFNASRL